MYFYLISSFIFLLIQTFVILTTKINIFPELVYYPWLMSKGLLIYHDFAVQHGYFLHLLLLPFSLDKSLVLMKCFYIAIQTINLVFVLLILKKTSNKLGFILGCGIFISLNYYLSDSNLWDEMIVTTFYLCIYFLLIHDTFQNKKKLLIIGTLIGLVSFMKPSFVIMLIPVILYYRTLVPTIPVIMIWVLSIVFYALHGDLYIFLDNYIFYNKFYASGTRDLFSFPHIFALPNLPNRRFVTITGYLLFASMVTFGIKRNNFKNNPIILFVFFSLCLYFPGYNIINLTPFGAFFCIFIAQILGKLKKQYALLYLIVLVYYGIFISQQAKHAYKYFKTYRQHYLESTQIKRMVAKINKFNLTNKKIYIFGNRIEFYYFLDKLPPVWYTVVWQVGIQYYPDIEQRTISELKKNKVDYILMPKPMDSNYVSFKDLIKFIKQSYAPIYEDNNFQMLKKIYSN